MADSNIDTRCAQARDYVTRHRLRDAFRIVRGMVPTTSWRITSELDKLEEHYALMINYAMDGAPDPQRESVHADIMSKLLTLIDRVGREAKITDSPDLYFSTVRYERTQPDTIETLLSEYRRTCSDNSAFSALTGGKQTDRIEIEQLERRIFNKIWTSFPVSASDIDAIASMWTDDVIPELFKELTVSALFLELTEWFDEPKLMLLLDAYGTAGDKTLGIRALCAALLILFLHRAKGQSPAIVRRIAALRESSHWTDDVRMVFLQFIRTRDTEKINRKVRDELLPEMLKLKPEIYKKINDRKALTDLADIEENPEWQELIDNSGITDKLKELSEMQADGGDVFMGTFAQLKTFPFFNEISNWFLPFSVDNSNVRTALGHDDETIGQLLSTFPLMCDSDKYSMALSIAQMPQQQRDMVFSQLNAQNINLSEIRSTEMLPETKRKELDANRYVHDLYRFFKLFRRKNEFSDPFASPINLTQIKALSPDLTEPATLRLVGEFYFQRGYWSDALELFNALCEKVAPESQLFQKMGYAEQHAGRLDEALEFYRRAELIDAESLWTQRRLAACLKLLGQPQEAIGYFRRIEAKIPDDISAAINIGHCLLELGEYSEAMNQYHKVEFLDEKSTRAWRPLAWCAFLNRDFDTSLSYYHRLLATESPTITDRLNMGHLALARHAYREAIDHYRHYLKNAGNSIESLIKAIDADRPALTQAGIDCAVVPLVIDAILYTDN